MNGGYKKEKKNSRIKWIVLFLLLIILVLWIVIGTIFCKRENYGGNITETPDGGVGLVIDPDSENVQLPEHDNTAGQDVVISGRGSMMIPANKKNVPVDFYNPEENAKRYYLTFELRLYNDSGQDYDVLYTSGLVEPGKHINKITLSHGLEKGVYDAVVHVQPYRMNEEKTLTNNADMKTRLIVK